MNGGFGYRFASGKRVRSESPSVAYAGQAVYEFAQGATWESGYSAVCKTVYTSSILVVASIKIINSLR